MPPKHLLFLLALLAQIVILGVGPVKQEMIRVQGQVVTLQTRPTDRYVLNYGYFVKLRYEITDPLGFTHSDDEVGQRVYTILETGAGGIWKAVGFVMEWPSQLGAGQVVIKGRVARSYAAGPIRYGIESYYLPEPELRRIRESIDQNQGTIRVDVAVDAGGNAAILRLHVGDEVYEY